MASATTTTTTTTTTTITPTPYPTPTATTTTTITTTTGTSPEWCLWWWQRLHTPSSPCVVSTPVYNDDGGVCVLCCVVSTSVAHAKKMGLVTWCCVCFESCVDIYIYFFF